MYLYKLQGGGQQESSMIENPYPGRFVTFEGLDGSGLTTQAGFLTEWIEKKLGARAILTKEPTDGPAGAQIRMALEGRLEIDEESLALLFAADRMDHLNRLIIPRLRDGLHIVCDRYYLSSFAYQSLHVKDFDWLVALNSKALRPDLTVLLHVPPSICVTRMAKERFGVARYEKEPELAKVWDSYSRIVPVLQRQGERIAVIEAGNLPAREVRRKVEEACKNLLRNGKRGRKPPTEPEAPLFSE